MLQISNNSRTGHGVFFCAFKICQNHSCRVLTSTNMTGEEVAYSLRYFILASELLIFSKISRLSGFVGI